MRVAYESRGLSLGALARKHGAFMAGVMEHMAAAEEAGLLRTGDAELATRALAKVAVPLLRLYGEGEEGERAFVQGVSALLLKR